MALPHRPTRLPSSWPAASALSLLACLLASCVADPIERADPADLCPAPPSAGELLALPVTCADQLPRGARGGLPRDFWLANTTLQAVFRAPSTSLTLPQTGGGTLVDAAPWDLPDGLIEVTPLVDGLVIDTSDARWTGDAWQVRGLLAPLPGAPLTAAAGQPATVRWSLDPDGPWLRVQGADALYVHPSPFARRVGDWMVVDRVVYGHDGAFTEDLGGAVVFHGASALLVAPIDEAWRHHPAGGRPISGSGTPGTEIEAWSSEALLAVLPVGADGTFSGWVPSTTTRIRASAPDRAPSPFVEPSDGVDLSLEDRAVLLLQIAWPDSMTPRPLRVHWHVDEQSGLTRVSPDSGRVPVPSGRVHLTIEGGPGVAVTRTRIDVPAGAARRLNVGVQPAVQPPHGWILSEWGRPDGRGPRLRALPGVAAADAAAQGVSWLVLANEHAPARATTSLDDGLRLQVSEGLTLRHPLGGVLTAWPWSGRDAPSARGVPRWLDDLPWPEALRSAAGVLSSPRTLLVDMDALSRLVPDWRDLDVAPDLVRLPHPSGDPLVHWSAWLDLLSLPNAPLPVGPRVWLDANVDPTDPDPVAPPLALAEGRVVATTGPWIGLEISGHGPGQTVPRRPYADRTTPHVVSMRVDGRGHRVNRFGLLGPEGWVASWAIPEGEPWEQTRLVELPETVVGVAWHLDVTGDWAATAPVVAWETHAP